MNAVAISGPFGSTMATRSLRPMPERVELRHGGVGQLAQAAVGQRRPIGCQDRRGIGGMRLEQVPDGLGHGFLGSRFLGPDIALRREWSQGKSHRPLQETAGIAAQS